MNGKKIYDPIHGFIPVQPHLLSIIDTQEFQRLRDLKQLGATHYVFPSATHTRFEHSLGVSFLARKLMESLQKNQPSLKITERQIQLVEIAGLIHDLGHGPFSHLWDNYVIFKDEEEHEERSCVIFSVMISKYNLPITEKETEIICELINPSEEHSREWMFQIVANKRCQLDVDKIDYIQRDSLYLGNVGMKGEFDRLITEARVVKTIDDTYELGWFHRLNYEIFSLFTNRYRMHKLVYNHHTVKAYEYLILDILKNFHNRIHQESPVDRVEFLHLTDAIVNCQLHTSHYKHIQDRLYRRKIPKIIGEHIISRHTNPQIYKKICNEPYPRRILNMMIDKIDIGFSSGNINPMDEIYYYKKYNLEEEDIPEGIKQKPIWNSKEFSETILRCYHLNPDNHFESDKLTYELGKTKNEHNWNMYLKSLYAN
jgi:deoxynucleoside triphosphate triphosphohydrolase SAMHD1